MSILELLLITVFLVVAVLSAITANSLKLYRTNKNSKAAKKNAKIAVFAVVNSETKSIMKLVETYLEDTYRYKAVAIVFNDQNKAVESQLKKLQRQHPGKIKSYRATKTKTAQERAYKGLSYSFGLYLDASYVESLPTRTISNISKLVKKQPHITCLALQNRINFGSSLLAALSAINLSVSQRGSSGWLYSKKKYNSFGDFLQNKQTLKTPHSSVIVKSNSKGNSLLTKMSLAIALLGYTSWLYGSWSPLLIGVAIAIIGISINVLGSTYSIAEKANLVFLSPATIVATLLLIVSQPLKQIFLPRVRQDNRN